MAIMNARRLRGIKKRLDAATAGPWVAEGDSNGWMVRHTERPETICWVHTPPKMEKADAEFIAHAPADVSYLARVAREQDAEIRRLKRAIEAHREMRDAELAGVTTADLTLWEAAGLSDD